MNLRRICTLLAIALLLGAMSATLAQAKVGKVFPGESIQAAIDAADPGDTIIVFPGTYQEDPTSGYGLRITKDHIRLIGKRIISDGELGKVRLIANGDQETGVYAAPEGCEYRDSECASTLNGFYIRGFSVEEFPVNGIQTRWVDGFKMIRNESVNNLNNGLYPTLSANGLVQNNVSYGSLDTSLWVAGSENVRVIGNELYGSPIGFEITVSNNVWAKYNDIHDNTIGVGLFHPNAAGNPPLPVMEDWVLTNNKIYNNNLPNPAPPASFQAGLPPGGGVLMLGVSDHIIGNNFIDDNEFYGIGLLGWCTATSAGDPARNCENRPPIADPSSNNNLVHRNKLNNNGLNPFPSPLAPLAADILYLQTPPFEPGTGNCFRQNTGTFSSSEADGQLPTDGC
ncbi:MAG: right-handed parallel beta-helix repeat-containing protein [Myxococcota bacterium]